MKTRLHQLEVIPGRPDANTNNMLAAIEQDKRDGVALSVFPEMVIPGYLLSDEWERESFVRECAECGQRIAEASGSLTVLFGNIGVDWTAKNEDGRVRKYNALFAAHNGQFIPHPVTGLDFFIKMLMPNYREFDDNRHFYDPRKLAYERNLPLEDLIAPVPSHLGALGCFLCEDGWDDDYNLSPVSILAEKGAQLLINLSASPFTLDKNDKRNRVFAAQAKRFGLPLLYVNHTGLQDNGKTLFTFDGASCAYDDQGQVLAQLPAYQAGYLELNPWTDSGDQTPQEAPPSTIEQQFHALVYGTEQFMRRLGIGKVVVGVSGGIDSALVASLYRHILAPENLLLVSMPGPFSSATTRNLARQLAHNLGCYFTEIPIDPSVATTEQQLQDSVFCRPGGPDLKLDVSDFVRENIQARDRSARILAAVAAAFGGVFTCNANKSELTVGYSTLYGDLGGYLANIGDLWKQEVYAIARLVNDQVYGFEAIPQGTLDIVPSAELSNAQNVDAGEGDPLFYPYHDTLFRSWVERWQRATPEDNLLWYRDGVLAERLGYPGDIDELFNSPQAFIEDLERWWNLYQGMAVAKRIQAPPILAVKRRAFGFDHRESQLGPRYSSRYQNLKAELLAR